MNPNFLMLPGMYTSVDISTGEPEHFLTLPQTAITYNPYGDVVYIVTEKGKDEKGNPQLFAMESFVEVGETRGDQVAILSGLKEGERVVTSGQLKLKNGSLIVINNDVVLSNDPTPHPPEE